uniref:GPI alpha-1,4-mannosyltransferase I, catalytic subunit n=1 Tax=Ditylenchus dipsaci TaxID=166011 RepID=A0A915D0C8_9BILA
MNNQNVNMPKSQRWTFNRLLWTGFSIRLLLVFYAKIHDHLFDVNFTDIDYKVFSDAADLVSQGKSPYDRPTYRYTPLLAWMLLPNVYFPDFGKILFCLVDVATAWLLYKSAVVSHEVRSSIENKQNCFSKAVLNVCVFWLFNPFICIISARGNADSMVCAAVLLSLYLLNNNYRTASAIVHGALAVHLKVYPIIYLPSIFLSLVAIDRLPLTFTGFKTSDLEVLDQQTRLYICHVECSLFHQHHNSWLPSERHKAQFLPYFYPLYLARDNVFMTKLLSMGAFFPQLVCILVFAFKFHKDLPFCWFLSTYSFVSFNKVCTSQYFIWYLCFLPLIYDKLKISIPSAIKLVFLWLFGQAIWLLPVYLFEFQGWNTLLLVWLASLLFLCINCYIMKLLVMVFYLIGLGLGDVEDITVRGLNAVRKCSKVYLEAYTSILCYGLEKQKLEEFYERSIICADREFVEQAADTMLEEAKQSDIAMLVVGDPFGATTHADLVLRAKKLGVETKIVHNASIMNAVGCCGLQLYTFGQTVSIDEWHAHFVFARYKDKEQSVENILRGRKVYEPARYMTCADAAKQLLLIYERKKDDANLAYDPETKVVGLARVGWNDQKILYCSLEKMAGVNLGAPLHTLIIPGHVHPMELEMLDTFEPTD